MRPYLVLDIPENIGNELLDHAGREHPLECCGLLAGTVEADRGIVRLRIPIRNDLASPTEYETNPRDLLDAMKTMRAAGLEPLAFYHSHPSSEPVPSRSDLARNTWGEVVSHAIVNPAADPPIRAWWLGESAFEPVHLRIVTCLACGVPTAGVP